MENGQDPPFIANLLNPDSHHTCFFLVGNPTEGPVERIGVVSAMLMAHSLVMRRALSVQETEVDERWDIAFTETSPEVFKNVLRFTYGFNKIKSFSMLEAMDMLKVADRLVMQALMLETSRHIIDMLSTSNICIAISDPVSMNHPRLEHTLGQFIADNMKAVLNSENLHMTSCAWMKYIVQMDDVKLTKVEVWRGAIRWARQKVLKENPLFPNERRMERYTQLRLVVPSREHTLQSSLTVVQLAEEALAGHSQSADILSSYHYVPSKPPQRLFISTDCRDNRTVRHEEMDIKVVQNCSVWTDPILKRSSDLYIHTSEPSVELYSIICTGLRQPPLNLFDGDDDDDDDNNDIFEDGILLYNCRGTVTVLVDVDGTETTIANIDFKMQTTYEDEFEILLNNIDERIKLQPTSKYKINTNFSCPHPLWYSNDVDYFNPNSSKGLEIGCGVVNKKNICYGSHVKYLLYKTFTG